MKTYKELKEGIEGLKVSDSKKLNRIFSTSKLVDISKNSSQLKPIHDKIEILRKGFPSTSELNSFIENLENIRNEFKDRDEFIKDLISQIKQIQKDGIKFKTR